MRKNSSSVGQRQGSDSGATGGPASCSTSSKHQSNFEPQIPAHTQQSDHEDQNHGPSQWKRRCREELDRSYRCREPNCTRRYEAWRSLQRHLKVDHSIKTRKAEYVDEDSIIAAPASQTSAASNTSSISTGAGWGMPSEAGRDDGSCATSSPESAHHARHVDASSLDSIVVDPSFGLVAEDYHVSMSPMGSGAPPPVSMDDAMMPRGSSSTFFSSSSSTQETFTTTTTTTTTTVSYESGPERPPETQAQASQPQRKPTAMILNATRPLAMRKPLQQPHEKRRMSPPYLQLGGPIIASSGGEFGMQPSAATDMAIDMSPRGEPRQAPTQIVPNTWQGAQVMRAKSDLAASLAAKKKAAVQRKQQESATRPGAHTAPHPTIKPEPAPPAVLSYAASYMGSTPLSIVRHNSSPPRLPSAAPQQMHRSLPSQPSMSLGPQAPPSQRGNFTGATATSMTAARGQLFSGLDPRTQQQRRLQRPHSLNDQELEMLLRGSMPATFAPPQLPPTDRSMQASAPTSQPPHTAMQASVSAGASATGPPQLFSRPRNATGITVTPPSAVASAVAMQQAASNQRYQDAASLRSFLTAPFMALNPPSASTPAPTLSATPSGYVDSPGAAVGSPADAYAPLYTQLFPQQWAGSSGLAAGVSPLTAAGNPGDLTIAQQPQEQNTMARPLYPGWSQDGMHFPTLSFPTGDMLGVPGLWGAADASLMVARQLASAQSTEQEQQRHPGSGSNDGERTN